MVDEPGSKRWDGDIPDHPELYDILHENHVDDIALYERFGKERKTILECGIGSGRIAIPLAREGVVVYGIDNSPQMLALLESKLAQESQMVRERVHFCQKDMCDFDLGLTFGAVFIPFMTFNYLPNIKSQVSCLTSVARHMADGSTLVVELMSFYREWFYDDGISRLVARRKDPNSGRQVEVFRITRFDPATQIMEHDRHYRFIKSDGRIVEEKLLLLRNRFIFLGEARLLMERCGLNLKEVWGDRQGGPYTQNSQVMILMAMKESSKSS